MVSKVYLNCRKGFRPSKEASAGNSSLTKNSEPVEPSEDLTELSVLVHCTYLPVFYSQRKFISWRLCFLVCLVFFKSYGGNERRHGQREREGNVPKYIEHY